MSGAPAEWVEAVGHYQAGRLADAEAACRRLLARVGEQADALGLLAAAVQQQGRAGEAESLFVRVTELQPDQARAWNNLGNNQAEQGKAEAAVASYGRALALQPDYAVALKNLGQTLRGLDRLAEALERYRRAVALQPDYAEAYLGLALTLAGLGEAGEAQAALRQAIAVKPDYAEAYNNLGNLRRAAGALDEAIAAYRQAITLKPDFAEAHSNLGFALRDQGRLREGVAHCRKAVELRPDYAEGHINLGLVLQDLGDIEGAVAMFRRSLALDDSRAVARSDLIFALDLLPGTGFAEQQAERRRWWERHGAGLAPTAVKHGNARDPERRLRIGYVSSDFRRHSAAIAFAPILRRHEKSEFDIFCYAGGLIEDDWTAEFRRHATQWRVINDLSDAALAERIRADGIDLLVDLSGHSAGNRLPAFARKPAPVQVTAWGHATGTGLATMDYLFADRVSVPETARPLFVETVYDLPAIMTYEAPADAPPIRARPAAGTFGCFNRLAKVTPPVLALWSRILAACPDSHLVMKDAALDDAAARTAVQGALAGLGIASDRLTLLGGTSHGEQLQALSQIDVALDPFPQNGGISTYEALWMGAPVVTLRGHSVPSRVAASILSAVGLSEWIADDEAAYIRLAIEGMKDQARLSALRSGLRRQVASSAAGDPLRYTRAVETAYRSMWRRWCAGAG